MNLGITKDKAIVHIANVANKEVVIVEDGFEAGGPDLFTDGDHHQAKSATARRSLVEGP